MTLETLSQNGFTTVPAISDDFKEIIAEGDTKVTVEAKSKTKRLRGVTYCDLEINLDAGANHIKGIIKFDGIEQSIHFPSRARIVDGGISADNIGNFTYGEINYASGKAADYYKGEWLEAKEGNKVEYLDIWFLASLAHAKKILSEVRKRRKNSKSIKLRCYVRLLTLSKERKGEISKLLKEIERFTFNNCEYEVSIASMEVFTEGYGSAISALSLDLSATNINILDMGGGTLSFTSYSNEFEELDERERTIADCGGINAIVGALQVGMASKDNAGIQLYPELLEKSLRVSRSKQVLYDFGSDISNIFPAFTSAMADWLKINPQVQQVLKNVRFALINDEKIYLTGGGFSSLVVRDYVIDYLTRANGVGTKSIRKKTDEIIINRDLIVSLENGHILNITGLQSLPSLIPAK